MNQFSFFSKPHAEIDLEKTQEEWLACGSLYRAAATAFMDNLFSSLGTLQPNLQSLLGLHLKLHPHISMRNGLNTPVAQFKHLFETASSGASFLNQLATTFYHLTLLGGLKHPHEKLVLFSKKDTLFTVIERNALPILAEQLGVTIVCHSTFQNNTIAKKEQHQPALESATTKWTLQLFKKDAVYEAKVRFSKKLHPHLLIQEPVYHAAEEETRFMTNLNEVKAAVRDKHAKLYRKLASSYDEGVLSENSLTERFGGEMEIRLKASYALLLPEQDAFDDDVVIVDKRYPPILSALARFAAIDPQFKARLFDEFDGPVESLSATSAMTF
ncbi:MAG: hypothetical protein NTW08_02930 [Gammaproteobacteria bacterium]|nr:hypothetical protein [Gammaproteobacteria bacterium]